MSQQTPLLGLDDIPWSELSHAYGEASDVPALLRQLASDDGNPMHELYGNIFHQGTRYQATPYAVPFVAEVALNPECTNRLDAMELLVSLAIGYDEAWLPRGINIVKFRQQVASWLSDLSPQALAENEEFGSGPEHELATYEAVNRLIPEFIQQLHNNPALHDAGAIAYLLAWFPDHADMSVAVLRRTMASVSGDGAADHDLIATCLVVAGLLLNNNADLDDPGVLEARWLEHPSVQVRAAAAMAMVNQYDDAALQTAANDELLTRALSMLFAIMVEYEHFEQNVLFGLDEGDMVCLCHRTIDRFPSEYVVRSALPAMKAAAVAGQDTYQFSDLLLRVCFEQDDEGIDAANPVAELPPWVIDAMQGIAAYGNWSHQHHHYLMRDIGLPEQLDAFRAWLAPALDA